MAFLVHDLLIFFHSISNSCLFILFILFVFFRALNQSQCHWRAKSRQEFVNRIPFEFDILCEFSGSWGKKRQKKTKINGTSSETLWSAVRAHKSKNSLHAITHRTMLNASIRLSTIFVCVTWTLWHWNCEKNIFQFFKSNFRVWKLFLLCKNKCRNLSKAHWCERMAMAMRSTEKKKHMRSYLQSNDDSKFSTLIAHTNTLAPFETCCETQYRLRSPKTKSHLSKHTQMNARARRNRTTTREEIEKKT